MKINKTMVIAALLIVIALGGGFVAGMQFQKGRALLTRNGSYATFRQNGQTRMRFGQNGQNFRPVRGQVLSIDASGLTVKLSDGSSRIVVVSGTTTFVKSASAAQSDVKTGDTVMVVGTQNSDGSITALDVQINPPALNGPTPTAAQ